ncbi:MAG TPA: hypothetical protein VHD83_17950 [Puia sp.]|nr:hypothetical protein [Puia sp.]
MKKLSYWARDHRAAARILIILLQLLLTLSAVYTGQVLRTLRMRLDGSIAVTLFLILLTAALLYPRRGRHGGLSGYRRQKACDFLVAMSCCCLLCFIVNRNYTTALVSSGVYGSLPVDHDAQQTRPAASNEEDRSVNPPRRHRHTTEKIALILCVIALAAVCFYGVASLSCSLSCSGSTGLAVVVLAGGLAGIFILGFLAIRSILRWGRRNKLSVRRSYMPGAVPLR